jgi:phospholipase C
MYIVSPWSKGGWVNSQVFDHTSVAQFLERRFRITIPAISPWHRVVSGDLTSAFDFINPNTTSFPKLPDASGSEQIVALHSTRPKPDPPQNALAPLQESGVRQSRGLPYQLEVEGSALLDERFVLDFRNDGSQGVVFHVYDKLHLDRIPRRYTVEANKSLNDSWSLSEGKYDLQIHGPNGFLREFRGELNRSSPQLEIRLAYDSSRGQGFLRIRNVGRSSPKIRIQSNEYFNLVQDVSIAPREVYQHYWSGGSNSYWYDLSISTEEGTSYWQRLAGRIETEADSISDPAMGRL